MPIQWPLIGGKSVQASTDTAPTPIDPSSFDAVQFRKMKQPESTYLRYNFERNWYRNILFYIGKQWIAFDRKRKEWIKPNIPDWMPLPVTNRFASTVDAVCSVLEQVQPKVIYAPANDSPEDINTSDICNSVVDIIEEETEFEKVKAASRKWLGLTGDAYWITYYDNSPRHGTIFVPNLRCNICGYSDDASMFKENKCPNCGSVGSASEYKDETGKTVGVEYPKGKIVTECASDFEMYGDVQCPSLEESPYVFRVKTYPLETIQAHWPERGYKVTPEAAQMGLGQMYLSAIAYSTNSGETELAAGQLSGGGKFARDRASVWQMWIRPCPSFPDGLYAVTCGDVVLEDPRPLEYHDDSGKAFVPIIHIKFKEVPGRLFGKTPADDLIHKQIQRNKLESFIMLSTQRMSNAQWLIPQSCGVIDITGEPGEKIQYNDSNVNRAKPEKVAGVEITQSIFRWLEKIDSDFEELAATYDVIKGNVPKNTPTLGGLEVLKERGLTRFSDVIASWENGFVRLTKMWLNIWKEYATEPRIKQIRGEDSRWTIKQFNNTDISGNVNVRAEPGSSSPRSEAYQQYIAGQLLEKGLIDLTDVGTRVKLFQKFHAGDFADQLDADVRDAIKEQEEFKENNTTRLRVLIDNHDIHLAMHRKFAKTEDFMSMPTEIQQIWLAHIEETERARVQLGFWRQSLIQQISGTVAQPQQLGTPNAVPQMGSMASRGVPVPAAIANATQGG